VRNSLSLINTSNQSHRHGTTLISLGVTFNFFSRSRLESSSTLDASPDRNERENKRERDRTRERAAAAVCFHSILSGENSRLLVVVAVLLNAENIFVCCVRFWCCSIEKLSILFLPVFIRSVLVCVCFGASVSHFFVIVIFCVVVYVREKDREKIEREM
jgi:hypothetical protein